MNEYNNPNPQEIKDIIKSGQKPMMMYHISKEEVLSKDLNGINRLMSTVTQVGKDVRGSLVITCSGYDHISDELHEIQEVREFVELMFRKHPYLLYYVNRSFEADAWLLRSYADEVVSKKEGRLYTGDQLLEEFGLDYDKVPRIQSHLTFKNGKLDRMLYDIIRHSKLKKDVKGGKKIAVEYAFIFDNTEQTLKNLRMSVDEATDILRGEM
ncbi:hypothetical protein [Bacillus wiedmannii]|uniref:hypothetical protein n=1 Tax=Bacillus wiedmannii TaxID=1890302 RepID=UPI0012482FE8|nr:hypothetical protein [Bacillus wiedmannii]